MRGVGACQSRATYRDQEGAVWVGLVHGSQLLKDAEADAVVGQCEAMVDAHRGGGKGAGHVDPVSGQVVHNVGHGAGPSEGDGHKLVGLGNEAASVEEATDDACRAQGTVPGVTHMCMSGALLVDGL